MTTYEYKVISKMAASQLEDFLNHFAQEGWQYVQYIPGEGYIFERTINPKPKATRRKRSPKKSESKSQ